MGFTLIELLVVIAIIVILAALVLPTLSATKDRARRTTCLNNLHQINIGIHMYADDSNDTSPTPGASAAKTNFATLYSGYKKLTKDYVGSTRASSPQDKLFGCPSDTFYPSCVTNPFTPWHYVHDSLHNQSILDYSSYAFNGGDNSIRTNAGVVFVRLGLSNAKLTDIINPSRTVLVAEASAGGPWSWHEPSSRLLFSNAKNMVSFVDGHVSYIEIYWDSTPYPNGYVAFANRYNPPPGYDYKWSPK